MGSLEASPDQAERFWKQNSSRGLPRFPRLPYPSYIPRSSLSQSLDIELSQRPGLSISATTLIHAAWALTTSIYGNTDEAAFAWTLRGTAEARTETASASAVIEAALPVRITPNHKTSVSEYLRDVHTYTSQLIKYQYVDLQHVARLDAEAFSTAGFQNFLTIITSSHGEDVDASRNGTRRESTCATNAKGLLNARCTVLEAGCLLRLEIQFDQEAITRELVGCMLNFFEHIVAQLALASPDTTLENLDILSPYDASLYARINTDMPKAIEKTLHAYVEEWAKASPNSTAVDAYDGRITYAELDDLSSRLASYILDLGGLGIESHVTLCFAPSKVVIITMLAVLKCGAVCAMTNPDHPTIRIVEMSQDVDSVLILSDEKNVARFQEQGQHVIAVTPALLSDLSLGSADESFREVQPNMAAFVAFTSGSTGKPKGTILEHRSLVTGLFAVGGRAGISTATRTLQFAAYTFDISLLDIFSTLMRGGCVCVISEEQKMNRLADTINECRANFTSLTTTVLRLLTPDIVPTLETIILAGEMSGDEDYALWAGRVRLFNGFGPSETTPLQTMTLRPVSRASDPRNVGHALGCHVWITNPQDPDRLAPFGCVGEIVTEGCLLGREYLHRPEATAKSFIHDPLWSQTSTGVSRRFYRTGDLAKMQHEGSIVLIGRADDQVKVNGIRIELGEVEDQIRRLSSARVDIAVDILRTQGTEGGNTLIVFCSRALEGSQDVDTGKPFLALDDEWISEFSRIQRQLYEVLPRYMVPSIFIPMARLPKSASGKRERKKLRAWVEALAPQEIVQYFLIHDQPRTSARAPETDMEKKIQAIWAAILQIPSGGIHAEDSFFRLGGDSVAAMKHAVHARSDGLVITVSELFRYPVLEDLAARMSESDEFIVELDSDAVIEPMSLIGATSAEACVAAAAHECKVVPDLIEDIYPCTPTQEMLVAASSYHPEAYLHHTILKLPRSIDLGRFKSAWEKLVAQYPIFRTRIIFQRGLGSLQVVLRSQLEWNMATGLSPETYLRQQGQLKVEYGKPLSRFSIIENARETTFVGTFHHALYDGWSLLRTYEEFSRLYRGEARQKLTASYTRFVRHISASNRSESDSFWLGQFPDVVKSFPQLPSSQYIPQPRHTKLSSISLNRRSGSEATLATVIEAAWAILMAKYSDSREVIFGLTLAGRDAPIAGIDDIMGPTVATIPLRVDVDRDMTVAKFLDGLQKKVALVSDYQYAGLQRIRQLSREASAACDFQNILVVQVMSSADITAPLRALGLQTSDFHGDGLQDLALAVQCTIGQDSVEVLINYDDGIVQHAQVDLILHQLAHIATSLVQEPQVTKLADLGLVSTFEMQRLNDWNVALLSPLDVTLHGLVEAQAQLTPNAIATSGFDGEYTYKELCRAADRLAVHLERLGARPELCVALCFRKSTWAIIATLAVLKSGAVCVPFNAEHPLRRRLSICEEVNACAVLCDAEFEAEFASQVPLVLVVGPTLFDSHPNPNPGAYVQPSISPKNAAFIIYTSGSTGKPKGCILEHHAVSLSMRTWADTMGVSSETRALQFAAYSFDCHILEIFGTLVGGGTVCVISDDERMNDLTTAINSRKATMLMQTPTVARMIDPAQTPTIDTVVLGAEPLTQNVIDIWTKDDRVRLAQHYAPAETCNLGCINFDLGSQKDPTNIGHACHCAVWITDSDNPDQLCPIGCVGEILIEGANLGRGYLKRPEATSSAFIHDPAWSRSGNALGHSRRFYRTGDMGCFNPDGTIKFIGRADTQVKIHGQRVELAEVETQIFRRLPPGSEVVVEIANLRHTSTLVSFIKLPSFPVHERKDLLVDDSVRIAQFRTIINALEESLPKTLPQYMVPAAFIPVSFMPQSASAKIERKLLRQLAERLSPDAIVKGGSSVVKQRPTSDIESTLQLVWSQVLNQSLTHVGTNDTFMALGGDSITAMQIVSECRRLGIKVQVSTILQKKTIAEIAPHCTTKTLIEHNAGSTAADDVPFDLSPIQKFYFEDASQKPTRLTQSFLCRVKCGITSQQFRGALDFIVGRHAMLRARFDHNGPSGQWRQRTVAATPASYRFQSHELSHIDDQTRVHVTARVDACVQESLSSLDISAGLVFSVDFFDVADDDSMVYLLAHHLVIDLVSWRIIWRDLEDILQGVGTPDLPPPSLAFQDWVSLQNHHFKDTELSPSAVYPVSAPPSNFKYWGVRQDDNILERALETSFSLPVDTTSLLLGQANGALHTTPLDILIGLLTYSFQLVFDDREPPSIFIEHHGRETPDGSEEIDLSQIVGWFTSLYPIHIPRTSSGSPEEAIRTVKDVRHLIPKNGQPYFAMAQLSATGNEFASHTPAEMLVNFSGQFQQLETRGSLLEVESRLNIPEYQESRSLRFSMIDIQIGVHRGAAEFTFQLHKDMARRERTIDWISEFKSLLIRTLPVLAAQQTTFTLSDFPRLQIGYEDLKDLISIKLPQSGLNNAQEVIEDIYPCTLMQEGILLSQQTDSEVYRLEYIWEFLDDTSVSQLHPDRLRDAWNTTTQKHPSLRTGLIEHASDHGNFLQVMIQDLPANRFVEEKEIINDIADIASFPQSKEEMFWVHVPRLTIYRLRNGRLACGLKLSHALMDGTSVDIFITEFVGILSGADHTTPTMGLGKYLEYERSTDVSQSISYWAGYLKDSTPCHIPTKLRPKNYKVAEDYKYIKLAKHATDKVPAFCQRLDITQAGFIQAAWAVVLGAFTGQNDVCFGYLASVRDAPLDRIEGAIGLYISMQVCRVLVEGTVGDVLQGVHRDVIAAMEHRNCSLAQIQRTSDVKSGPLFNTCMTVRRAIDEDVKSIIDQHIKVLELPERTEFAIALDASVGPAGVQIGMSYQTSVISSEYAHSIAGSLETVMRGFLRGKDQPIRTIEIIGEHDRGQVERWNPESEPVQATLHSLVEAQMQSTPDAIAISGFDGQYTYGQLNSMASRLAAELAASGVRPEARVVLCFAKSTWPIVSMLAILKTGGVCVSTNPDHPNSRLLEMCNDVQAAVVLCDRRNASRFQDHIPRVLVVDDSLFAGQLQPTDWVPPVVNPENSAFVVYTSGSTGTPKGCILRHHSVAKSQLVNAKAMSINASTRAIQFAAYTFDASICEIFAPLVTGACVCVISDEERMDGLADAIIAREANWIMLTPTVAQLFSPSAVPSLKTLVFGGEALSRRALEIWCGHVHLVNYWGPSECSNSGLLNDHITLATDPLNIGRASGCRIWITEQNNPHRLAPIGCVGELVVEGPMLGVGYLNRPEATAASFVADLNWSRAGSGHARRFYRTGDLGRFNADGSITFAGRADNQVKIHGQRVELNEIKYQIATNLPNGSEVIVDLLTLSGQSSSTLTAFIKLESFSADPLDDNNIEVKSVEEQHRFLSIVDQLEQQLLEILPSYMIPSAYIPISKVPTTPSAKTDKKRLAEFARSLSRETVFVRQSRLKRRHPSNDMERDLQSILSSVLNHPAHEIGVDDTFMSLGGDSISAMQVVAQCSKIGIKIPVSVILQKKTIAGISLHCTRKSAKLGDHQAIKATDGTLFDLSPIQKQYFSQESPSGWVRYNQSLLCSIKKDLTLNQVKDAFDTIVNCHAMLRSRFRQRSCGEWQQLTLASRENLYRFKQHDLKEINNEIHVIAEKSEAALDIVGGPVFSVDFFQLPNQDGLVYLTAHHLLVDLVSWRIILRDFQDIVQSGQVSSPQGPTFQQWCHAQEVEARTMAVGGRVLPLTIPPGQFEYWQVPAGKNVFGDTLEKSIELSPAITELVLKQSNNAMGTTPLEVLLGPLLSSFRQVFREREVPAVFIENHGREPCGDNAEPSQLVGWFTTTYPVHVPCSPETSAIEAIRLVKDLRRKVPQNGRPYYAYRHLTTEGALEFSHHGPAELLVNFAGSFQQLEATDSLIQLESRIECKVSSVDPAAHRWAMIDVEIGVSQGAMKIHFLLNKRMAHLDRVQHWIRHYGTTLSQTAADLARMPLTTTLSDFPLLDIDYSGLNSLISDGLGGLGVKSVGDIEDILPLSNFQQYSIDGHLDVPVRHWLRYFFDLPDEVDVPKLQLTCEKMVRHYPILRTLFMKHDDHFLQVVLKSLNIKVDLFESVEPIATVMERAFADDAASLPSLGKPWVRFMIVRSPTCTRLLMRLSHAQFDGFSRIDFVQSLAALYGDQNLPPSIGYSELISQAKKDHIEGCRFWRARLADAQPTFCIDTASPAILDDVGPIIIQKTIPSFRAPNGVTSATAFNAACALLVRSLTGSLDITFARMTSARAALKPELQNLVGPCVNMVPVRVRFIGEATPSEILQQIHEQYLESIPYETVGLDDIIRQCTDWSTSMSRFPILTQHLNLEEGSEAQASDGATFGANVWEPPTENTMPWSLFLGAFPGCAGVRIAVMANSRYVQRAFVERVHDDLCAAIDSIAQVRGI